jgi:hypothetical protein
VVAWARRNWQLLAGLLISGWSIWLLLQAIDPAKVGRHLAGASWPLVVLCFLSIPCSMLLKIVRQLYLFADGQPPGVRPLLSALYIGYLMNTVLPARVGEFVRAYLIGREPGVGVPAALATIVVEKVLDLLTLGLILAGLVALGLLPPGLPDWLQVSLNASALALAAGVVGLVVVLASRGLVLAIVGWLERRVPPLARFRPTALAASFLDGLAILTRGRVLAPITLWSIAIWASAAFTLWTALMAVGISPTLPMLLLALVVTNIGMAVPSAPGYVGVFHYLLTISLVPFGVDENLAAGAAVLNHAIVFGNFIVGGLWFLWRGGYSMGSLRDASGH